MLAAHLNAPLATGDLITAPLVYKGQSASTEPALLLAERTNFHSLEFALTARLVAMAANTLLRIV